ncbi:MAG: ABC transporter permease subunit [Actinomycetota bacterium]|nr:ABC transporter permease subunit [Actinomycetota bacterium]
MIDLVAAEWLKLRTTRLLLGMIPAIVAVSLAAVAGTILTRDGGAPLESSEGIRRALSVTGSGAILVLVLGILISAGEYRHGTAADTFLTTPRRHQALIAKLAVGAGVGLAAGAVTSLACVGLATVLYIVEGATFPFDDVDVWLSLAGILSYTTLFAVLGVALGSLVRNQVLAVASALAWFAVIEHTLVNLAPDIGRWFPAAAGQAIVRTPLDGLLSPLAGAALLVAYGTAITAAGIRVAATRDA